MNKDDLIGTFRLVSWRREDQSEPFGPHPDGVIHYCADGRMSVTFLKPERTRLGMSSEQVAEATKLLARPVRMLFHGRVALALLRYMKASTGFMAYAGTYEVKDDAISHHVDVALVPDDIGTELVRKATLIGPVLTLATASGDILTWERLITQPPAADPSAVSSPPTVAG